jgi:xanthine dehydrogenase/oxidase
MWQEAKRISDYDARFADVQEFNKNNRYIKRGIALIPTKFGISFTAKFLNQVS